MGWTYNAALQQGFINNDQLLLFVPMTESHQFCVISCRVHTTHETLIIAEKEDRDTRHYADGVKKRLLIQFMSNIVLCHKLAKLPHAGQYAMQPFE